MKANVLLRRLRSIGLHDKVEQVEVHYFNLREADLVPHFIWFIMYVFAVTILHCDNFYMYVSLYVFSALCFIIAACMQLLQYDFHLVYAFMLLFGSMGVFLYVYFIGFERTFFMGFMHVWCAHFIVHIEFRSTLHMHRTFFRRTCLLSSICFRPSLTIPTSFVQQQALQMAASSKDASTVDESTFMLVDSASVEVIQEMTTTAPISRILQNFQPYDFKEYFTEKVYTSTVMEDIIVRTSFIPTDCGLTFINNLLEGHTGFMWTIFGEQEFRQIFKDGAFNWPTLGKYKFINVWQDPQSASQRRIYLAVLASTLPFRTPLSTCWLPSASRRIG